MSLEPRTTPPVEGKKRTIWDLFSVMENGRLKSTFLMYSFALGFVDLAVYFLAYLLLLDPLEALLGGLPVWLVNAAEGFLPAAAGTALCIIPCFTAKDKRVCPAGFLWMTLYLVIMLAVMLVTLEAADRSFFLRIYGMFVWAPVLLGCGSSVAIWLRQGRRDP